jgi:hypothetical protein
MKKIYLFLFIILISCDSESFIPDNIKSAFPVDYYKLNDTLKLTFNINDKIQDSISLIINKNEIENGTERDYIFGSTHEMEIYSFEASSSDNKQQISFYYTSMENRFEGYVNLNAINFSFEIIEKKVDSIEIGNKQYRNIYLLRSEYYENTYAYMSKDNGIVEIVNDSIKLITLNN